MSTYRITLEIFSPDFPKFWYSILIVRAGLCDDKALRDPGWLATGDCSRDTNAPCLVKELMS